MDGIDLKIARIRADLKQKELAAMIGICPALLCAYEPGKRQPRPDVLDRIIKAIEGNGQSSEGEG